MKKDKILSSMGQIDEKYIAEYEKARKAHKHKIITRAIAIAASVCLVIGATAVAIPLFGNMSKTEGDGSHSIKAPLSHTESSENDSTNAPSDPPTDEQTEPSTTPLEPDEPQGPFTVLNVTADKTNGSFVSTDSDFIIEAENATADLVREHIYISGGPEYTVTDEGDGKYRVSIDGNLSAGGVVNLSYANGGVTEYSWAFETERKLEIISVSPASGEYEVDTAAVIELTLSMVTDKSIEDYVTFSPSIEGSWEQTGKVHRFYPKNHLSDDAVYTVTVASGFTYDGYTMEEGCISSFSTGKKKDVKQVAVPAIDGLIYSKPNESPVIRFANYAPKVENVTRVTLHAFAGAEDMISYLKGNEDVPLTDCDSPAFTLEEHNNRYWDVTLDPIEAGCYLVNIFDDYTEVPRLRGVLQVNDVSAYALALDNDVLIWSDTEGLKATLTETSATTDSDGIAVLRDAMGTKNNGYVYLGEDDPLVLAVPYNEALLPNCYLYTDKPIYKTDDTVSFFGALPADLFFNGMDGAFTVNFHRGYDDIPVETVSVTPDENGALKGEFSFTNLSEGRGRIVLCYNGKSIAYRYFDIEDYSLQNYTYEIYTDKTFVRYGDNLDVKVAITHISGVPVAGKSIRVRVDNESYYATTDEAGIARFTVPCPERHNASISDPFRSGGQVDHRTVYVYSGDTEEGASSYDSIASAEFYAIYADANFSIQSEGDTVSFESNYIKPEEATSYDKLFRPGAPFSGTIRVKVTNYKRFAIATKVDPDTGLQYTEYSTPLEFVTDVATDTFTDVTEYLYDKQENLLPEPDEFNRYSMALEYSVTAYDGSVQTGTYNLSSNSFDSSKSKPVTNSYSDHVGSYHGYSEEEYSLYRYSISMEKTAMKVGESCKITIRDDVNHVDLTEGEVLLIIYKDSIAEYKLVPASELTFTYEEDYGAFVEVTAAYCKDGRFYRMGERVVTNVSDERTVTITTETDKESYSPGETVTLTVKTALSDGSPVSATVNVSVVNEAIFLAYYHSTDIYNSLINRNYGIYPQYSFSSYHDTELSSFVGGMGGGGGDDTRIDFADTACFENVVTDENGMAQVTFTLPDSVTTYRITTHAATADMRYGTAQDNFSVNMDFFLQSSAPRGQKTTDDYVAAANTVTDATGSVNYTFTLKETEQVITATAATGASASANFGKLAAGSYTIHISAECGELTDAMEYPFTVTAGAMYNGYTDPIAVGEELTVTPASYPVKVELYTENTKRYLDFFAYLDSRPSTRMDGALSKGLGKELRNTILGEAEIYSDYSPSADFIKEYGLSLYDYSDADPVLTALCNYYCPEAHLCYKTASDASADVYTRSLLVQASVGKATLQELGTAGEAAGEDTELIAIIAMAYAFSGDYDNAAAMYKLLPERSDVDGVDAMRAIVATFIDRENAGEYLEILISEEPNEHYLGFAAASYLKNRVDAITEEHTLTLTVNGQTTDYTVSGIVKTTVVLSDMGSESITLKIDGEGVCGSVTYTDYERKASENTFTAYIEGDLDKYGTVYLVINASEIYGRKNYQIALPPSLRASDDFLYAENVFGTIRHEKINMTFAKECSGLVYLPLLVTQTGNYTLESIKMTDEYDNVYYSEEINFDVN